MTSMTAPDPRPTRRRRWPWAALAAVLVLGAVALALFQPWKLFVDDVVDEALPEFAVGVTPAAPPPPATATDPTDPTAPAAATDPTTPAVTDPSGPAVTEPSGPADATGTTIPVPAPGITATGTFESRDHPTEGTAVVLSDGGGRRVLRFEDFATDNGPDLFVYLSAAPADGDEGAFDDDFVRLDRLKGNIGAQNYEIPPEVDLARYSTVVIWCDRFNSAFGVAALTAG